MYYICTGGCHGESDVPGTCQAIISPKHGQPLTACDCRDGKHYGRMDQDTASGLDSSQRGGQTPSEPKS